MKNKIFYFLTLILLTTLTGCEENIKPTDIEFVTFSESSKTLNINLGTTLSTEFKIYTANKVASATNLAITVTSTIDASNYTIPASVTIAANSNEATISVSITENNLDQINGETLSLAIEGPNGFFIGESLDLKINVFCPFDISDFYGTYDVLEDDTYTYEVVASQGPVAGTISLYNLYETSGTTIIGLDISDSSVKLRSREFNAALYVHPTYGNVWANAFDTTTPSSFNVCSKDMSIYFRRTVSVGSFAGETKCVLTKK
jgi:hypothetical protein